MPITFAPPPDGARAVLDAGLAASAKAQKSRPDAGGALAVPDTPTLEGPLAIYTLDAAALARGEGAERASLAGWRYLIVNGGEASRAAELSINEDGSARYYGVTAGRSVAATLPALAQAHGLSGTYEARSLRVPGLSGQALWLHCTADPARDRFFLLPLVFKPLEAGRPYTAAELIPLLKDKAAAGIAAHARLKAAEAPR